MAPQQLCLVFSAVSTNIAPQHQQILTSSIISPLVPLEPRPTSRATVPRKSALVAMRGRPARSSVAFIRSTADTVYVLGADLLTATFRARFLILFFERDIPPLVFQVEQILPEFFTGIHRHPSPRAPCTAQPYPRLSTSPRPEPCRPPRSISSSCCRPSSRH